MTRSDAAIFRDHLSFLYGPEQAEQLLVPLLDLVNAFKARRPLCESSFDVSSPDNVRLTHKDAILITYADIVQEQGQDSLRSLHQFLARFVSDTISTVHLLPFYPYSSDDGFSVIDYRVVDSPLGTWEDIANLGVDYRLMFDAVINHISSRSAWFQGFLHDEAPFIDYFIVVPDGQDLTAVFRPRALPLLTNVQTNSGMKSVWTTFSEDQIDLNFGNPDVLIEIIDLLLDYAAKGAEFIRLDAIAYLWKEPGTSCIHLPQTHRIVQLFRSVLDATAPGVSLITETNVPHQDNVSYFGDGNNEAQLVYNFSLPPLLLHSFHSGDASDLTAWAKELATPSAQTTFFNFTASHDGIGVLPVRDIIGEEALARMVSHVESLGGFVSYKSNPDGSKSPYELNMNYLDALEPPGRPGEGVEQIAKRFLCSQAIMLSLKGLPGLYFHSLVGSRGWTDGVAATGRPRSINREKLDKNSLELELLDSESLRYRVFHGYTKLLRSKAGAAALDPFADQQVISINPSVFSFLRSGQHDASKTLCIHNVSAKDQSININIETTGFDTTSKFRDAISGREFYPDNKECLKVDLRPYDFFWLIAA